MRVLLGIALSTVSAAAAFAGEFHGGSIKDAPILTHTDYFSGFYVGANAGYGWDGEVDYTFLSPGPTGTGGNFEPINRTRPNEVDGFVGGGQVGYNFVRDSLLFGAEATISGGDLDDQTLENPINDYRITTDVNYFGSVVGRLGLICDRTLFYGRGGWTFASVDFDAGFSNINPPTITAISNDYHLDGYVVGVGVEHALSDRWSIGVEYNHYDFGSDTFTGTATNSGITTETVKADFEMDAVTARLNYRFAGGLW